jgi:hypothetical protein
VRRRGRFGDVAVVALVALPAAALVAVLVLAIAVEEANGHGEAFFDTVLIAAPVAVLLAAGLMALEARAQGRDARRWAAVAAAAVAVVLGAMYALMEAVVASLS